MKKRNTSRRKTARLAFVIRMTDRCNLDCEYCYQRGKKISPDLTKAQISTILKKIRYYLRSNPRTRHHITLNWHGGEPLIVGARKLKWMVELADEILGQEVNSLTQGIQTNGTIISNDYISLFKEYGMSVGVSCDFCNDTRRDTRGHAVEAGVIRNIKRLKDNDVRVGITAVISSRNVNKVKSTYGRFRKLDLPVFFMPARSSNSNNDISPTPKQYGKFLVDMARIWIEDDDTDFSLPLIENYISLLTDGPKGALLCRNTGCCYRILLHILPNGNVTNCSNFTSDRYVFGNIFSDSVNRLLNSPKRLRLEDRMYLFSDICGDCRWFELCKGDCPGEAKTPEEYFSRGYFCEASKMIFDFLNKRLSKR